MRKWELPSNRTKDMTFKEGVKSWMRNYDATYDEAVALEKMYRDSDKEPSDARTQDLYDALINYPHGTEKSVQEDERGFDQTAKADKGKIRPTLVPRQIIRDIAVVREYGNRKYHDPDNWKEVEVERYRDALCRHLLAYLDDPKSVDEESGIPHYKHMATNMAFICEMESWDGEKM